MHLSAPPARCCQVRERLRAPTLALGAPEWPVACTPGRRSSPSRPLTGPCRPWALNQINSPPGARRRRASVRRLFALAASCNMPPWVHIACPPPSCFPPHRKAHLLHHIRFTVFGRASHLINSSHSFLDSTAFAELTSADISRFILQATISPVLFKPDQSQTLQHEAHSRIPRCSRGRRCR
jgi:hypothetical protein